MTRGLLSYSELRTDNVDSFGYCLCVRRDGLFIVVIVSERRNEMRRLICVLALACIVVAGSFVAAEEPAKIKVLLITGNDVGAHPWREISETTRELLVASKKFD